ncbi:hypothetical protein [Tabrizicola sp. BL-A-41-H6]
MAEDDAFVALCDHLRVSLTTTATTLQTLLYALLTEVLSPKDVAMTETSE